MFVSRRLGVFRVQNVVTFFFVLAVFQIMIGDDSISRTFVILELELDMKTLYPS